MYTRDTQLLNKTGLHARPATLFVDTAKKYSSKIKIENLDDPSEGAVNAKSVIMLLTLGLSCGTHVRISAVGDDEEEAVDALVHLIENVIQD